jgi:hypothetical protein
MCDYFYNAFGELVKDKPKLEGFKSVHKCGVERFDNITSESVSSEMMPPMPTMSTMSTMPTMSTMSTMSTMPPMPTMSTMSTMSPMPPMPTMSTMPPMPPMPTMSTMSTMPTMSTMSTMPTMSTMTPLSSLNLPDKIELPSTVESSVNCSAWYPLKVDGKCGRDITLCTSRETLSSDGKYCISKSGN